MKHRDIDMRIRFRLPEPELHLNWQTIGRWMPTPGNVIFTLLVLTSLLWAQSAGALPLAAPSAASTGTIAYQGRLADTAGQPLTGTYNMTFRLYSAASGGAPMWEEPWNGANSVQVSDGLFNVMLGSLASIPQNIVAANSSLFLGITVGTDSEMTPRVQLGSVPFAVQALTVPDGSITSAKLANGSVTAQKISDSSIVRSVASTNAKVQFGSQNLPVTCDWLWITFPEPYTSRPIVLITQREASGLIVQVVTASVSNTKFAVAKNGIGLGGSECTAWGAIDWMAIGN